MTKAERQEMMAKAREAKQAKSIIENDVISDDVIAEDADIEYDFSPYEVIKEKQEYGCRLILLLKGLHKAEFHGEEAECYKDAEAFIDKGDTSKVVSVYVG